MSRIAEAFKNGKAFIPFMTCGDPDLETTAAAVRAAAQAGAASRIDSSSAAIRMIHFFPFIVHLLSPSGTE